MDTSTMDTSYKKTDVTNSTSNSSTESNSAGSISYSIGPGVIAQSSQPDAPAFALSSSDWYAIQTYVNDGLTLPVTDNAFRSFLSVDNDFDISDFEKLIAAYQEIKVHVTTWQQDIFPASVSLASDIHSYSQQAPVYYNPISLLAEKLQDNPNDEKSKNKLTAILQNRSKEASEFHIKAASVADKISQFVADTLKDKTKLVGDSNTQGLYDQYNQEYGEDSEMVKELMEEMKEQSAIMASEKAEYEHDVVVAATTPTYAWWFPFGTIPAAIVAGVYGDRATKAKEKMDAAQQKLDSDNAALARDYKLMASIHLAQGGITSIVDRLNDALPIIQKIQGEWKSIADDLNNIADLIINDIQKAIPIIMDLGVEAAIEAWTNVGKEADTYRINAYITVSDK